MTVGDTIYALSSGRGKAGVAVIRLSGPAAGAAFDALCGTARPPHRMVTRVRLTDPDSGRVLDDALAVLFEAPASYTGEDVVEFQVHGGRAVIAAVLQALAAQPGLRMAEPGEFTKRAFLNEKMDLTAAEGVIDLVEAETEMQRRQALRQAEGALARLYDGWRATLVDLLARVEAEIEFPDEDLNVTVTEAIRPQISPLHDEMSQHLADQHRGERLRDGVSVAIVGAPNAGKSSLLNALARRDAAIVSATEGTTRDVIEVHLDLGGYPVLVADTAGLRAAPEAVEAEGVRRALDRGAQADLVLNVVDATDPQPLPAALAARGADLVVVWNKTDLAPLPADAGTDALAVSAETGTGLGGLLARLQAAVADRFEGAGEAVMTRERHREAVTACVACLERAMAAELPELAAEDLRLAARALGRVTGRVDVEELLDVVFREFCIGK